MGAIIRLLLGAEALRHLPMPKKLDHLFRRIHIALIALTLFALVGVFTGLMLIIYVILAMTGALPR